MQAHGGRSLTSNQSCGNGASGTVYLGKLDKVVIDNGYTLSQKLTKLVHSR